MDKGMDKNIKTLLDDTKKLIREKRAMYSGPEEMASFIAYLDYCAGRLRGPGKLSTWAQITNLRCDIVESEKRFIREAGKADPEVGRKLRLMQDEAYQEKWGIRYINSSLPEERLRPAKKRHIKKNDTFRELLRILAFNGLSKYYHALYGESGGSDESVALIDEVIFIMSFARRVPTEMDCIMLEECEEDGKVYDHAYILDSSTGERRELGSVHWKTVLGCLIPYDITMKEDMMMFAALVVHEMVKDGVDIKAMRSENYVDFYKDGKVFE